MKKYKIDMTKIASQIVEEELEQLEHLDNRDIVFSDKVHEKMRCIVSDDTMWNYISRCYNCISDRI